MGTVPFTLRFFKMSFIINVFVILVCATIDAVMTKMFMYWSYWGLFPVIFCDMVIQCSRDPEKKVGFCFLFLQVKSKYHPILFILIWTAILGTPQLHQYVGLAVGYLYVWRFLKWTDSSAESLRKWENRWPFSMVKSYRGFRPTTSALQNNPRANEDENLLSLSQRFFGGGNSSQTAT